MKYKRPNWINFGFANGGPRYPVKIDSAHADEELPIAKIPDGFAFKPGQESIHAGKGSFYTLRYGEYLIAMNTTKDKTFDLAIPTGVPGALDLISGKQLELDGSAKVGPRSSVVLYFK
jgi:hypothetical protein